VSKRQDLIEVLEGRTPVRTPYTILDWIMERAISSDDLALRIQDDRWRQLLDRGLTIRHHCPTVRAIEHGVEYKVEEKKQGNDVCRVETKTTPVGSISTIFRNRWCQEHWVKTPEDYRVQQWIVENTELIADYQAYEKALDVVGEHGIVALTGHGMWLHRTPLMTLNIDYMGTEQFCMDMAMEVPEFNDLYQAQMKLFMDEQRLIATGPGRYVMWCENLTVNMVGPRRYAELMMPVYREAVAIHEAADKRVMVHYDGAVNLISDQIAGAPYHIIDSLTEPSEGDMSYDQCRAVWPEKVLLANINVDLYAQSKDVLRQAVIDKRLRAGKRAFAFEISEDCPANWQDTIPVVLDTICRLD
jgi:hypothetical protein